MRSTAVNQTSQASGLGQVMPINLPGLGFGGVPGTLLDAYKAVRDGKSKLRAEPELQAWLYENAAAYRKLSNAQQVPFTMAFYRSKAGKLTSATACYVATFLPRFLAHAGEPDFVLAGITKLNGELTAAQNSSIYGSNITFDPDTEHGRKGWIQVDDLTRVVSAIDGTRWRELLARIDGIDGGGGTGPGDGTSFVSVSSFDAANRAMARSAGPVAVVLVVGALAWVTFGPKLARVFA